MVLDFIFFYSRSQNNFNKAHLGRASLFSSVNFGCIAPGCALIFPVLTQLWTVHRDTPMVVLKRRSVVRSSLFVASICSTGTGIGSLPFLPAILEFNESGMPLCLCSLAVFQRRFIVRLSTPYSAAKSLNIPLLGL